MRIVIKFTKRHNQTFVKVNGREFCMIEKRCGAPGETEYCVIHDRTHHVWKSMRMAKQFVKDLAYASALAGGDGETPPTARTQYTSES